MKKNVYMILMAALMVGCSTTDDDQLASDPIPMTLTATVGQTTRSTIDNTWDGEAIAVQTTQAGETTTSVKKYSVNSNGAMTLAKDENEPFYFRTTYETKSVSAWYPYSTAMPTEWTVQTDQSGDGYANSDLLIAPATEVTYDGSLKFEHQTAKLTINLTDETESGVTGVTVYGGITPHKGTTTDKTTVYNALLAPQSLSAAAPLFYVTTPDNIYIYSLPSALTLDKAHDYVYNIKVNDTGIELTSCTIGKWNDTPTDIEANMNGAKIIDLTSVTADALTDEYLKEMAGNGTLIITSAYSEDKMKKIAAYVRGDNENENGYYDPKDNGIKTVDLSGVTGMTALKADVNSDDIGTSFGGSLSLQKVILPTTVTDITYAFGECKKLTSITGTDNVTTADYALYLTGLTEAPYMPKLTKLYYTFYASQLTSYSSEAVTECGDIAFYGSTNLTSVYLPHATTIGEYAFSYCYNLKELYLTSKTFTSVNTDAFNNINKNEDDATVVDFHCTLYLHPDQYNNNYNSETKKWTPVTGTEIDLSVFSDVKAYTTQSE